MLMISTGIIFIFIMNGQHIPTSYLQAIVSDTSSIFNNSKLKHLKQLNLFRLLNINQSIKNNIHETTEISSVHYERYHQTGYYSSCLEYKINQPNKCKQVNYSIAFIIPSTAGRISERNAIRETWGGYAKEAGIPVLFLLGRPFLQHQQKYIEMENALHQDIVQVKCIDTYRNLSLKSVAMMKWVSEYCFNTAYILKADDDMLINVNRLLQTFYNENYKRTIFGRIMSDLAPHRLKKNSAKILYETSLELPYLHLEDVFMTGVVADKAGIKRVANNEFKNDHRRLTFHSFNRLISAHEYSPRTLHQIWKTVTRFPQLFSFFSDHRKN
ncbi:beta-1,3-galactosyltransferase 1-like [Centruroides sculpturatus]|uniref:beta-1,3-galactosyltransferase 1-like n=1 Tax=Centruroides sculpturatus TaxID=218467 RepID=UPI000C6DDA33|nr:beta-1,3-galactosyltransferase 1-like [Centruroides sculpturatus]